MGDWILCMLRKSIPYFGSVRSWRKSSSVRDVQWKVRVDLFNKRRKLGLAWTRLSNQLHSMGLEAQQLPQPCLQLIRASKNQKWHLLVATCPGKLQVLLEAFSNKNWEQKRSTQNHGNWVKASVLGHKSNLVRLVKGFPKTCGRGLYVAGGRSYGLGCIFAPV